MRPGETPAQADRRYKEEAALFKKRWGFSGGQMGIAILVIIIGLSVWYFT